MRSMTMKTRVGLNGANLGTCDHRISRETRCSVARPWPPETDVEREAAGDIGRPEKRKGRREIGGSNDPVRRYESREKEEVETGLRREVENRNMRPLRKIEMSEERAEREKGFN
ncbi:hypothetical protein Tco_1557031 [Tanacetum coccineum]